MFPIILYHHLLSIPEDSVCSSWPDVFKFSTNIYVCNIFNQFVSQKNVYITLSEVSSNNIWFLTSSKEHTISLHHYGRLYMYCNLKTNYCDCQGHLVLYFYGGKWLCCDWIQDTANNTLCVYSIFFPMEIFHCIFFVRYFCQVFLPPLCKT